MPIKEKQGDPRAMTVVEDHYFVDRGPLTPGSSHYKTSEYVGTRMGTHRKSVYVNTENFKEKVRLGQQLPENPFEFEWHQIGADGQILMSRTDVSNDGVYAHTIVRNLSSSIMAGHELQPILLGDEVVISRALSRARSYQWSVPVFLGELSESSKMVYNRATQLVGLIRAAKRGDFGFFLKGLDPRTGDYSIDKSRKSIEIFLKRRRQNSRQAAASLLMEYQYGWRPFVEDIRSAMNTLVDLAEEAKDGRDAGVLRVVASHRRQLTLNDGPEVVSGTPNLSCHTYKSLREQRRIVWKFRVKPDDIPARLGFVNLPETIWELTTLSWLVDWAIPIGDYLSGFGDRYRFDHSSATMGYKSELAVIRSKWESSDFPHTRGPPAVCASVRVIRDPMGMPELTLRHLVPSLPSVGPMRAGVAMALLSQTFDSLRRKA